MALDYRRLLEYASLHALLLLARKVEVGGASHGPILRMQHLFRYQAWSAQRSVAGPPSSPPNPTSFDPAPHATPCSQSRMMQRTPSLALNHAGKPPKLNTPLARLQHAAAAAEAALARRAAEAPPATLAPHPSSSGSSQQRASPERQGFAGAMAAAGATVGASSCNTATLASVLLSPLQHQHSSGEPLALITNMQSAQSSGGPGSPDKPAALPELGAAAPVALEPCCQLQVLPTTCASRVGGGREGAAAPPTLSLQLHSIQEDVSPTASTLPDSPFGGGAQQAGWADSDDDAEQQQQQHLFLHEHSSSWAGRCGRPGGGWHTGFQPALVSATPSAVGGAALARKSSLAPAFSGWDFSCLGAGSAPGAGKLGSGSLGGATSQGSALAASPPPAGAPAVAQAAEGATPRIAAPAPQGGSPLVFGAASPSGQGLSPQQHAAAEGAGEAVLGAASMAPSADGLPAAAARACAGAGESTATIRRGHHSAHSSFDSADSTLSALSGLGLGSPAAMPAGNRQAACAHFKVRTSSSHAVGACAVTAILGGRALSSRWPSVGTPLHPALSHLLSRPTSVQACLEHLAAALPELEAGVAELQGACGVHSLACATALCHLSAAARLQDGLAAFMRKQGWQ